MPSSEVDDAAEAAGDVRHDADDDRDHDGRGDVVDEAAERALGPVDELSARRRSERQRPGYPGRRVAAPAGSRSRFLAVAGLAVGGRVRAGRRSEEPPTAEAP